MRLVGYVRVSRVAGREGDTFISPAVQRERIEKLAAAHDHDIVAWHEDLDQPGTRYQRPGFQAALAAVENHQADGIIVAALDRFARSVPDAALALRRLEDADGVLVSVRDMLDTSTPVGRFARTMMLAIAELELERIRENWQAARERAIGRGVHISRVPPVGYQRRRDGRLEPDPVAAPVVRELFLRRAAGEPWQALCALLDDKLPRPRAWVVSTVTDLVRRRVYLGEAHAGDTINALAHEPLVTRAEWEAAQSDQAQPRRPRGNALLTGLVYCGSCGQRMTPTSDGARGYLRYDCRRRTGAGVCPAPVAVSRPRVDAYVERLALERIAAARVGSRRRATAERELRAATLRLDAAEGELAAYRDGQLVSILGADAYRDGLRVRAAAVEGARAVVAAAQRAAGAPEISTRIADDWPRLTVVERRHVLAELVERVVVERAHLRGQGTRVEDRVRVVWRGV